MPVLKIPVVFIAVLIFLVLYDDPGQRFFPAEAN